ncbi:MAG: GNAT family N-acetyltransferase [Herpetosiphonaceae bacterium]|nr:GNAT family N-acetyltransferase [Herpetosiphonaceae bacterium]
MKAICLHDKATIASFLRRNTALNVYALGDLDEFFWPATTWYGLIEAGELRQVVLVYAQPELPVLLALSNDASGATAELLGMISYLLPRRIYAHLTDDAVAALAESYNLQSDGSYFKMALTDAAQLDQVDTSDVDRLSPADLPAIQGLYRASYPGNWFDPRMLETGCYYGIWQDTALLSIAGIHVYSPEYRVAALGNITTRPEQRGRGLASRTTAKLCQSMRGAIDHISLNVNVENTSAIACYRQLGFAPIATYGEYMLSAKS